MTNKQIMSIVVIVVIVIAVAGFIKYSGNSEMMPANTTPGTSSGTVPAGTQSPKLPAGSVAPGNPQLLKGTTWIWEKTIMRDGSANMPKKPDVFTITFGTDDRISGKTDCNGFGGTYKLGSDGVLTFGPFMSTLMYCEGSQEREFTGNLAGVNRYTEVDGKLTLLMAEGAGTMTFRKK